MSTRTGNGRRRGAWLAALWLMALPPPWGAAQQPPPQPPEEIVLGKPSAIQLERQGGEEVLVTTGTRLYALPDRRSTLVDIVGADAPLPVLERASGWVRVRLLGQAGWAAAADGRTGPDIEAPPDLDVLAARAEPLAPLPERLARARAILGDCEEARAGPFTLYTDVEDAAWVERLAGLAAQVPAAYEARYGLEPWPADRFAVVVFATEAAYREFERHDRELAGLAASGHSAGNIAAVFAAGRREGQLASILLHELVHLLNRSAVRATLPPWLEEGLAEDLAFSGFDRDGKIDPSRLGGARRRYVELGGGATTFVTESWGPRVALARVTEAAQRDRLPDLRDLMAASSRQMSAREGRPLRYGQSALFVRYLLEGAGDRGRDALRGLLRQAADGDGAEPAGLVAHLDTDWPRLQREFERWLVVRSRQTRSRR